MMYRVVTIASNTVWHKSSLHKEKNCVWWQTLTRLTVIITQYIQIYTSHYVVHLKIICHYTSVKRHKYLFGLIGSPPSCHASTALGEVSDLKGGLWCACHLHSHSRAEGEMTSWTLQSAGKISWKGPLPTSWAATVASPLLLLTKLTIKEIEVGFTAYIKDSWITWKNLRSNIHKRYANPELSTLPWKWSQVYDEHKYSKGATCPGDQCL